MKIYILVALASVVAPASGVLLWQLFDNGKPVEAHEIIRDSRRKTLNLHSYDVTTTISHGISKQVYSARISGSDYHATVSYDWGGSEGTILIAESMRVDGINFGRRWGPSGREREWQHLSDSFTAFDAETNITETPAAQILIRQCSGADLADRLEEVSRMEEETLGSFEVERFRGTYTLRYSDLGTSDDSGESDIIGVGVWDFWIDSNGLMIQTRQALMDPEAEDDSESEQITTLSIISGVREPNKITAPEVIEG